MTQVLPDKEYGGPEHYGVQRANNVVRRQHSQPGAGQQQRVKGGP